MYINVDAVNAKYINGILTVDLPKKEVIVEDTTLNIPIQ